MLVCERSHAVICTDKLFKSIDRNIEDDGPLPFLLNTLRDGRDADNGVFIHKWRPNIDSQPMDMRDSNDRARPRQFRSGLSKVVPNAKPSSNDRPIRRTHC